MKPWEVIVAVVVVLGVLIYHENLDPFAGYFLIGPLFYLVYRFVEWRRGKGEE